MSNSPTFEHIQQEIANMLDVPDEELNEEQRALMDAYLDELGDQEAAKVDAFAQFLRLEAANAEACKKEAQRLSAKARTAENRIAWLKNKYMDIMMKHGLKKVSGNAYTISMKASESVLGPKDEASLKALYDNDPVYVRHKETFELDKQTIKEALKGGLQVPGCELKQSYSLQVR